MTLVSKFTGRLRRAWLGLLERRIEDCVEVLRRYHGPHRLSLRTILAPEIPARVEGFEDLAYLFAAHQANRGVIAQDIDEAAYLWSTITALRPRRILEIGRWLGGSTVLLCAAASQYEGEVISVDLKVKAPEFASDDVIREHLERLGLRNFELNIGRSAEFVPEAPVDFAFIDGDHSYEGVKADCEQVRRHLQPRGHLLFHDACATRRFATLHEPVARFMAELERDPGLRLVRKVGSIVHFEENGLV